MMEEYFKRIDYISNSMLGWLSRSPAYYKHKMESAGESTPSMELGTMVHMALLEPELFVVSEIDKPSGLMGLLCDKYLQSKLEDFDSRFEEAYILSGYKMKKETVRLKFSKEGMSYVEERQNNPDVIYLDKATKYTVDKCVNAVTNNPEAFNLLQKKENSFSELEIFWEDKIKRKGKIDRLVVDIDNKIAYNIDVKTSSKNVFKLPLQIGETDNVLKNYIFRGFMASYISYGYYRQQAYYEEAIKYFVKEKYDIDDIEVQHIIIAIETITPNDCAVYKFNKKWIEAGKQEVDDLIDRWVWHTESNNWNLPVEYQESGAIIQL
jgi:hypothetical protein